MITPHVVPSHDGCPVHALERAHHDHGSIEPDDFIVDIDTPEPVDALSALPTGWMPLAWTSSF